ncbi:MAG: hypothetical protein KGJ59_13955 [Bacteroidota bacterium]|nr:hypothetical protein [Bacteroidota bacterium]
MTDIVTSGDSIWLGTGKGLSLSTDRGATWKNFYGTPEFGQEDISALAVHGKEIWVATAHTVTINNQSQPEGSGLRYSPDGGMTWKVIPQPRDTDNIDTLFYNSKSTIRALGITTNINNITYDIALTDSAVWIASFAGMLRKSTDHGETWQRVIIPPDDLDEISPGDSLVFDLAPTGGALGLQGNYNHRLFSVVAENDSTIWAGTADGLNLTTDGGRSWKKFSYQNETEPITGNFVVALYHHYDKGKNILWAATAATDKTGERRGVSVTEDYGVTWKTTLLDEFAHNFGSRDSIVYTVTDNGIFRSSDEGTTWLRAGSIFDPTIKQQITQPAFYSAAAMGDTIFFGGDDGIAVTYDSGNQFGAAWNVLHASQAVGNSSTTYAYPNPFSPNNEIARLHYSTGGKDLSVTVRIFDFGMNLVRTVISNAVRSGSLEHDEIWDGTDDAHRIVANGPYFYQVVIGNNKPVWGKILVIK